MGQNRGERYGGPLYNRLTGWLNRRFERFRDEIVTQVSGEVASHVEGITREFDDLKEAVGDALADEYAAGARDQRDALGIPESRLGQLEHPQPGRPGWRRDNRTGVWWHTDKPAPPDPAAARHGKRAVCSAVIMVLSDSDDPTAVMSEVPEEAISALGGLPVLAIPRDDIRVRVGASDWGNDPIPARWQASNGRLRQ